MLIEGAYFWTNMGAIFQAVEVIFRYELDFPQPIGPTSFLEIFCSLSIMYMLADLAESYFGWTGSDGDNR